MIDPYPDCTCGACISRRLWIAENVINLDTMITAPSPFEALFVEWRPIPGESRVVVIRRDEAGEQ